MGHKENVMELLKEHKLGLIYKDLLKKYEEKFKYTLWGKENPKYKENPISKYDNRKNGYYYLRELKQKGLIDTYTPVDNDNKRITEGKIIAYRLTEKALNPEKTDEKMLEECLRELIIERRISEENSKWMVKKLKLGE